VLPRKETSVKGDERNWWGVPIWMASVLEPSSCRKFWFIMALAWAIYDLIVRKKKGKKNDLIVRI